MINYVIILQLVFAVFYTPSSGIPIDTWKYSSCLKIHKYNCIQKCIWNKNGILHHNVLQLNSPQFKNQYKQLQKYDSRKLSKFKKCLKKSLKYLQIRKCDDIARIDLCYTLVRRNAKKRVVLLSAYAAANKVVGDIVDPIVEGSFKMLYNFGKATLPTSLTDTAKLIAHDVSVVSSGIQHGIGSMKDGLIRTAGHLATNLVDGVANLATRVSSAAKNLLGGIGLAANIISNSHTAGSLGSVAHYVSSTGKEIANDISGIGNDVLGFVDTSLAKGIDTVVDDVKSVTSRKNRANFVLLAGDQNIRGLSNLGNIGSRILGFIDDNLAVENGKNMADESISVGKNTANSLLTAANEVVHGLGNLGNMGRSILGFVNDTLAKCIDTAADDIKSVADRSISIGKNTAKSLLSAGEKFVHGLGNLGNLGRSILGLMDNHLATGIDTAVDDVKSVADRSISVGKNTENSLISAGEQFVRGLDNLGDIGNSIIGFADKTLAKGIDTVVDDVKSLGSISVGKNTVNSLLSAANQFVHGLGNLGDIGNNIMGFADKTLAKGIDTAVDDVKSLGSISVGKNTVNSLLSAANQFVDGLGNLGNIGNNIIGFADKTVANGIDTAVDDVKSVADGSMSVGKNTANSLLSAADQFVHGLGNLGNIGSSILDFIDGHLAKGIDTAVDDVKSVVNESTSAGNNTANSLISVGDQFEDGLGNLGNIENSMPDHIDDTLAKGIDTVAGNVKSVADESTSVGKNTTNSLLSAGDQVVNDLGNLGNIGGTIYGYKDDTLAKAIDTAAHDVKNVADESISVGKNAANQVTNSHGNKGSSITGFADDTLAKDFYSDEYNVKSVADEYNSVGDTVVSNAGILNDDMLSGLAMYNY